MSNPTLERHARLLRNGRNQAVHYAQLRVALEKMDQPLGHNDLLIAARALGLTLVTDPIGKFSRVPGFRYWRVLKRVMRDNRPYTDVAMTLVDAAEFERLEIFQSTEAARAVAEKARRRTVKSLSKRSSL